MDKIPKLRDPTTSRFNERNNDDYPIDKVNKILKDGLKYFLTHEEDNITITDRLAVKYNEDGNLYFKSCKYTLSIICFQEGLKLDFQDNQLRADMWNNLSNVYYFLKNYRSSLKAAEEALELMPGYQESFLRAINCCIHMKDFNKSSNYCHIYLENIPQSKRIEMEKSLMMKIEEQKLLEEINKRKLYVVGHKAGDIIGDINILNTNDPDKVPRVRLTENQRLVWPVIFLCPEHDTSVVIPDFHEDFTFYKLLVNLFSERPPWDTEGEYNPDTVNIYTETSCNTSTRVLKRIHPEYTLSNVLTLYRSTIKNGLLMFLMVISKGKYENKILEDYVPV